MAQFQAFAPGVQVDGAAVLAVVQELEDLGGIGQRILARHGIVSPQPGSWYSQQAWLDAFREIAEKTGPATLRGIGRRIPETAVWPPEVSSIEAALGSIDLAYHLNHRGGEIGHYRFELAGPRSARLVCENPYPCAFDLGIVERTAAKFAPAGVNPVVKHDDTRECRQHGAEGCTYLVTW
ncbi:MAG TPA: hypothetical protein VMS93_07190 [Candidatus Saccharimonadales bacterium]|nr:hypothetical protein [Candidatus Saccharimonadales bacterium]